MKTRLLICATTLCAATALFAHSGVKDPDVMKRMEAMKNVAQDMKALGAIAKDPSLFDRDVIDRYAQSLGEHARNIPMLFEYQARDPKSEARDTIWSDWPGFLKHATKMEGAAAAVANATSSETFQAAFENLGDTCTSCHKDYRIKN